MWVHFLLFFFYGLSSTTDLRGQDQYNWSKLQSSINTSQLWSSMISKQKEWKTAEVNSAFHFDRCELRAIQIYKFDVFLWVRQLSSTHKESKKTDKNLIFSYKIKWHQQVFAAVSWKFSMKINQTRFVFCWPCILRIKTKLQSSKHHRQ